jgi:phage host-nuclease inhibitor protein Gam
MSTEAELHDAMWTPPDESIETDDEPFNDGDKSEMLHAAERHLAIMAKAQRELDQVCDVYDASRHQLDARKALAAAPYLSRIAWRARQIANIQHALLDLTPHTKTWTLPSGTLHARVPTEPRIEIIDREAFLAWAEDNAAELIRTKLEPDKHALNKFVRVTDYGVCDANGSLIPGVTSIPPEPSFRAEIAEPA